ncbi:CLUMA_CG011428, isoform A [Clunio marinus]|uniref:NADH dehydrogenase [ubiquinone] 1 alpha subcomplex subunit 10, mitochondrial n=1 Tax=Clunio marinus TaxID=568069 RepID=A0A1J1ICX8_9DIPT|nr:CLUMA_CG011428, isoform A [Clunio marinus]
MAGVFRFGVVGIINRTSSKPLAKATIPCIIQSCNISGKIIRATQNIVKPKPYPYKTKPYGLSQALFDRTMKRLDENSKMIVVEGPIAAGKSAFAKELADDLDMLYLPQPTMDTIYINEYGYDLRQLDPQLPESCKSYDVKNFCLDPNGLNAANFQIRMLIIRYMNYVDGLAHILSTGQGVVTNRCPFSDFIFVEAMHKHGYMSKGARSVYYDLCANTMTEILKPHLIVYLDVPVSKVKENIKKRGVDYEVKSKVFTDAYLNDLESFYKQRYLKEITQHSELLVYDWSNGGETEVVVEDIERIDFDRYDQHDPKLKDWRLGNDWEWCEMRMRFTNEKGELMNFFNVPRFDVPELTIEAEDSKIYEEIWDNAPGNRYLKGYNKEMGDTGILFKNKTPTYS